MDLNHIPFYFLFTEHQIHILIIQEEKKYNSPFFKFFPELFFKIPKIFKLHPKIAPTPNKII